VSLERVSAGCAEAEICNTIEDCDHLYTDGPGSAAEALARVSRGV
jgi:hypothetical protein